MRQILLVDDDRDDAGLFCEAAAEINPALQVVHYEDVPSALNALESDRVLPDCIFLDINLPVINGWEFLKKVKNDPLFSNIPVIMYTTSARPQERELANDLGASGFITKPNDYNEMIRELSHVLK